MFAATVLGFGVMSLTMGVTMSALLSWFGPEKALNPESWEYSLEWVSISLALGIASAINGGWVANLIDPSGKGVKVLVLTIVVLGILMVLSSLNQEEKVFRTISSPTKQEMISNSIWPSWYPFVNILLLIIGVSVGSVFVRGRQAQ